MAKALMTNWYSIRDYKEIREQVVRADTLMREHGQCKGPGV